MTQAAMELGYVMTLKVSVGAPLVVGTMPTGIRRMTPILGGTFAGDGLEGKVLPGGADWQLVRPDGVIELEARYALETADGVKIQVLDRGFRHAPKEIADRMARGEPVDPSSYYSRSFTVFEVEEGPYGWMNRTVFVGRSQRLADHVQIDIYKV
jgi:hypothetical protein